MSRPASTPARIAALRRTLGAMATACALALVGPEAAARPLFPSTMVFAPLSIRPSRVAGPGYLPVAGTPPLRWRSPPPPAPSPTEAPLVLYNPPPPARPGSDRAANATVTAAKTEAQPLQPKDFLPFFERENRPAPANAGPTEGLQFAPARPALPTSSADYRQK
jgi:hypothetical protein